MPNWCDNSITITGPNKIIDKIEKCVQAGDGLLNFICPIPKELKDTVSGSENAKPDWQKENSNKLKMKHGADNWYDWCTTNWGTKWDLCEYYGVSKNNIDDDTTTISFGVQSAWSPPLTAFETFVEQNEDVDVEILYYEPGCDFMGSWFNGADECYQCSTDAPRSDSDFWESEVGRQLDDAFGIVDTLAEYESQQMEEVQEWYEDGKKELKLV